MSTVRLILAALLLPSVAAAQVPAVDSVADIQAALASCGHFEGPVDGRPTVETAMALQAFARDHGRSYDGGPVPPDLARLLALAASLCASDEGSGN